MASINVGSIMSEAWSLTKKNLILILFVVVISCLSSALQPSGLPDGMSTNDFLETIKAGDVETLNQISQNSNMEMFSSPANIVRYLISVLVSIILSIGLSNTFLQIAKGKMTSISLKAFVLPVSTYVKAFLTMLISGLLISVSALLCVIPMFYVAPKVMFSYFYILDGRTEGVIDAIKMNWADSEGEVGSLLLLGIAAIGVVILGLICCCCGALVSEVVVYFAEVLAFLVLAANRPELNATSSNTEIAENI